MDMLIRREDRIENVFDSSAHDDQRQALEQTNVIRDQGGQLHRFGKGEGLIAQKWKGQMEPTVNFALIVRGLGAQPKNLSTQPPYLGVVIAKGASLRGAPAGTWDLVPSRRKERSDLTVSAGHSTIFGTTKRPPPLAGAFCKASAFDNDAVTTSGRVTLTRGTACEVASTPSTLTSFSFAM